MANSRDNSGSRSSATKLEVSSNPSSPRSSSSIESPSSSANGVKHRQWCLCSPTSHPGSFRCRLHRSSSSSALPTTIPSPISTSLSAKWKGPPLPSSSSSSSLSSQPPTPHPPVVQS
ncbi:hypothetical protein KP509_20G002200 [Ceratopteris richardii]|uniref:Uncharacterized protein n=1 Tax=Ceratopteris richardii TaxID=49495 RepID=A0A8T2SE35_CERRI|nr:hypothetical protein KP509_20G002200 [Ceratopteris richardii]